MNPDNKFVYSLQGIDDDMWLFISVKSILFIHAALQSDDTEELATAIYQHGQTSSVTLF